MSINEFMNEDSLRSYQSSKSLPAVREVGPWSVSTWSAGCCQSGFTGFESAGSLFTNRHHRGIWNSPPCGWFSVNHQLPHAGSIADVKRPSQGGQKSLTLCGRSLILGGENTFTFGASLLSKMQRWNWNIFPKWGRESRFFNGYFIKRTT